MFGGFEGFLLGFGVCQWQEPWASCSQLSRFYGKRFYLYNLEIPTLFSEAVEGNQNKEPQKVGSVGFRLGSGFGVGFRV